MKPKTKLQKRVSELMGFCMGMTNDQYKFAKNEVFQPVGYRTKNGVTCMECGAYFDDKSNQSKMTCPNCGIEISVKLSRRRTYRDSGFISIVTAFREFQLIKHFRVSKNCRAGSASYFDCYEVCQNWITTDGEVVVVARPLLMNSAYISNPFSHGEMAIRNYRPDVHDVHSLRMIYEDSLPGFRKLGLDRAIDNIAPVSLIRSLMYYPMVETVIKAGQDELVRWAVNGIPRRFEQYWNSIKICLRNNYIVEDAGIYADYLELLERYGKDLRNSYYVCPVDLKQSHYFYMKKKNRDDERLRKKRDSEHLLKQKEKERMFIESKKNFFDLLITDGNINVIPLKSLEDFKNEGDTLHHCVFTNEYFDRKDSLILSARKDDEIIETVEVNLKKFNVTQSRAAYNKISKYHEDILSLVKSNMNIIKQKAAL